jgi:hypothetical protein
LDGALQAVEGFVLKGRERTRSATDTDPFDPVTDKIRDALEIKTASTRRSSAQMMTPSVSKMAMRIGDYMTFF